MNKKGFELAVNNLVTIILMLVIMGVGFTIFFKLYEKQGEIDDYVSSEMQRMIEEEMISTGSHVVIPFQLENAKKKSKVSFYVGVENIEPSPHNFTIQVDPVDRDTEPKWIKIDNEFTLKSHERTFKRIWFDVPSTVEPKQYGFTVAICYDDINEISDSLCSDNGISLYPPKQKVYILVK